VVRPGGWRWAFCLGVGVDHSAIDFETARNELGRLIVDAILAPPLGWAFGRAECLAIARVYSRRLESCSIVARAERVPSDRRLTTIVRMSSQVIVVGGGLAGLAAATALAERGLAVTLLESRPRLGGRASSFTYASTGETIDNCQHVAMGCCTNFFAFCRRVGIEHLFERQPRLNFVGPDGRIFPWRAGLWPAPFHLTGAFLRLGYLSLGEKIAAGRALRALARGQDIVLGESFAAWLVRHRQPRRVIERFWEVVLVSALSESMDRIDVSYARKVFVDGFLANREGWVVTIPKVPLDEIYGGPLMKWLADQKVDVRLQTGTASVEITEGRAKSVVLRGGDCIESNHVVLAVPQDRILPLLPEPLRHDEFFSRAAWLETAPISSVHLWFDRPITELPHAVFVGRVSQWMFRRDQAERLEARGQTSDAEGVVGGGTSAASETLERSMPRDVPQNRNTTGHYYQIVVSASRGFLERPSTEAIEAVRRELAEVLPAAREAQLLHGRIVTEHKAVFSPLPGVEALRPPQQTPISNLQLAGDWTQTGWPATMEGAVRSGYLAAENVLRQMGRPTDLVVSNLPVSWWTRILMGVR
jgi:squalene-associated FAD-dependent desaturase